MNQYPIKKAYDRAYKSAEQIARDAREAEVIHADADFSAQLIASAPELMNPERTQGVTTGYDLLDKKTGGLRMGELLLVVADTGMGKSIFMINILCNIIEKTEYHCSYFDLENGKHATFNRFVSIVTGEPIDFAQNREGVIYIKQTKDHTKNRLNYRDHEFLAPIINNYAGEEMARKIGELILIDVLEKKTRVFVIDPLENFEMEETNYNAIAKVIIYFKNLAQEHRITIIILHHLNKPQNRKQNLVKDITDEDTPLYRIPSIDDVIGSKKITNIATDVWALVRQKDSKEVAERGRMLVKILKQREYSAKGSPNTLFMLNENNLRIFLVEGREG